MKVSSQPREDQTEAGADKGKFGLSTNSCPTEIFFHIPQMNHMCHKNSFNHHFSTSVQ